MLTFQLDIGPIKTFTPDYTDRNTYETEFMATRLANSSRRTQINVFLTAKAMFLSTMIYEIPLGGWSKLNINMVCV